ncbi:MAG: hypothetical protein ABR980_12080 [Ignavibacteriaceae bacterium]|jgi:hypothetical protein
MKPKEFDSLLFRRKIFPNVQGYWSYALSEILYRLDDKNMKECNCMEHMSQREKLLTALEEAKKKLISPD